MSSYCDYEFPREKWRFTKGGKSFEFETNGVISTTLLNFDECYVSQAIGAFETVLESSPLNIEEEEDVTAFIRDMTKYGDYRITHLEYEPEDDESEEHSYTSDEVYDGYY